MNFLSVKVLEEGKGIVLDEGSFKVKPVAEHVEFLKKYVGKELFFGIRPEDLKYVDKPADNTIPVKITVVEPLGADIHLWLTTAKQPLVARTEPNHSFNVGDKANFIPYMEKARYFDKETEFSILTELDSKSGS
jgi:multiple sugar transport system ATP-binding protein